MPEDPSDDEFADLLDLARRGDGPALDRLIRMVDRRLIGFLRARGAEDPHGTTNDVLLRVARSIESFDGNLPQFRAWVFTIARNRLIDEHRRGQRRVSTTAAEAEDLEQMAGSTELEIPIDQRERVEAILATLTEDQREVVLLRVIGGLSVDEVAEIVGRSPGAVRGLQHRALKQLRSEMSEDA